MSTQAQRRTTCAEAYMKAGNAEERQFCICGAVRSHQVTGAATHASLVGSICHWAVLMPITQHGGSSVSRLLWAWISGTVLWGRALACHLAVVVSLLLRRAVLHVMPVFWCTIARLG